MKDLNHDPIPVSPVPMCTIDDVDIYGEWAPADPNDQYKTDAKLYLMQWYDVMMLKLKQTHECPTIPIYGQFKDWAFMKIEVKRKRQNG